ncbi:MAG: hypothetical protein MZV63_37470 [Marinilabiliales bacterium]|nr:hypothetical protein [Marinilabiliales bacterium]
MNDELLMKRGKLAPGEMRQVRRSPIYSVKRIIRTRELNKLTIHRIITAYEHKTEFGKPVKDLKGNVSFIVPRNDIGVFSKIIAISDCYDALTSRRPHPGPLLFRHRPDPDVDRAQAQVRSGVPQGVHERHAHHLGQGLLGQGREDRDLLKAQGEPCTRERRS